MVFENLRLFCRGTSSRLRVRASVARYSADVKEAVLMGTQSIDLSQKTRQCIIVMMKLTWVHLQQTSFFETLVVEECY